MNLKSDLHKSNHVPVPHKETEMKAIVLDEAPGLDNLRLIDRPVPEPRRQEVVVRMKAAALNYRDVEIVRGTYHTTYELPLVPLSGASARCDGVDAPQRPRCAKVEVLMSTT
jgi:hypothetical protein